MRTKKNVKYVEANQIVKPGKHSACIIGIELERSSTEVSILGVGNSDWEDIDIYDVDPKEYKFKVITQERVHHLFSVAMKSQEKDVIDSEINLMKCRRNFKFCENKVKEYFGAPVSVEATP